MNNVESITPYLEPIRKTLMVSRSVKDTFRIFTREITLWWPKDRYSVSQERTRDVVLEPEVDGRIFEVRDDGETYPWGTVVVWEPPSRLVMSWHPGRPTEEAQEVEVQFTATDSGTQVQLEHRNWAHLGSEAAVVRDRYEGGWVFVLGECFRDACDG